MLIALDYDKTFTADPLFWEQVVRLGEARGHSFVCVTGRKEPLASHERPVPMPIVLAGSKWKRFAAEKAGYKVDVWIDDMPEMIAPTKILDFSGSAIAVDTVEQRAEGATCQPG